MSSGIRTVLCILLGFIAAEPLHAEARIGILREAAKANGLAPPASLRSPVDEALVGPGRVFFESNSVSLNGEVSCRDCHLDDFSSGDGIPNAIGIGGKGRGPDRALSGGAVIPRNTLPLWGRGGRGFDVLFWDGKVDFRGDQAISQFGDQIPSEDPLVTAIHLPPVEIREMLIEDKFVSNNKREDAAVASNVYAAIAEAVRRNEGAATKKLAEVLGKDESQISFADIATAIANFIRSDFHIKSTRFHRFVFDGESLSEEEVRGGLIFYGKGKCATCHSGPYLSDLDFHAVATPQIGFGKNGFGVDYGRYNVTHDPSDLYKFRTPSLFNVASSAPYGHSGAVATLRGAIASHNDPLSLVEPSEMSSFDRTEYYKRLTAAGSDILSIGYLDEGELVDLGSFLQALSFQ